MYCSLWKLLLCMLQHNFPCVPYVHIKPILVGRPGLVLTNGSLFMVIQWSKNELCSVDSNKLGVSYRVLFRANLGKSRKEWECWICSNLLKSATVTWHEHEDEFTVDNWEYACGCACKGTSSLNSFIMFTLQVLLKMPSICIVCGDTNGKGKSVLMRCSSILVCRNQHFVVGLPLVNYCWLFLVSLCQGRYMWDFKLAPVIAFQLACYTANFWLETNLNQRWKAVTGVNLKSHILLISARSDLSTDVGFILTYHVHWKLCCNIHSNCFHGLQYISIPKWHRNIHVR